MEFWLCSSRIRLLALYWEMASIFLYVFSFISDLRFQARLLRPVEAFDIRLG